IVLENGDVVITLSDSAYLVASGGKLMLMSSQGAEPLLFLEADPAFFERIVTQVQGQRAVVGGEIAARRDWLSWVGWTGALFSTVADDRAELQHLRDLDRRLESALVRV